MQKTLLSFLVLVAVAVGTYYGTKWLLTDSVTRGQNSESYADVHEPALGVQFEYRTSPDGFVLIEREGADENEPTLQHSYTLMREQDYEELQESTEPREGPPSMSLYVFTNPDRVQARMWANAHPQYSNISLARSEVEDVVVAGANAVRYVIDGLYPAETIVVPHGGFVYLLVGQYSDERSPLRADFQRFADSLEFIPFE